MCRLHPAVPAREGKRLGFCVLEMCRTLLSDEPFSVFPDDHGGALIGLCWNYPCFKGKPAFTLMNGLECHCSPAFFNSFFKQINQETGHWMCRSSGAFQGVLLNIKTTAHSEKNNPNKKVDKSLGICRSIVLNNKRIFSAPSSVVKEELAGGMGWGLAQHKGEVLMCVNTLKAMGLFSGDGCHY